MAETEPEYWLIVEPRPPAAEELSPLLSALSQLGIDGYTARQRLVGRGAALLARGKRETLGKAAALLSGQRYPIWLISPTTPRFTPHRIFALKVSEEAITFNCRERAVAFPRGGRVLAVLADLSGAVVEKNLKRLLVNNAYRGEGHLDPLADQELYQAILRAQPVLDLYQLSPRGGVAEAVRILPGKFDPQGLGKNATYSAAGNLQAILALAREQAGELTLRTDFGLATLPGCQPRRPEPGIDHERENLAALTHYGWLMANLLDAPPASPSPQAKAIPLTTALRAAAVMGSPVATNAAAAASSAGSKERPSLPPPPNLAPDQGWLAQGWTWLGGSVGALVIPVVWFGSSSVEFIWNYGIRTGFLPAAASSLLFLAAVQNMRWKRLAENTPTSRIRSLSMGMVEVQGRAVRRYALVSPMTQMACVWYRLRKYRRDRNAWRLTSTVSSGAVPFILEDATGRVQVDPRGAALKTRTRHEGRPGGGGMLFASGTAGDTDEHWVEEVIGEGTMLYILGFAQAQRPEGPSLRERTTEKLRRLKGDPQALKTFDLDGDGQIDAAEWDAARTAMEKEALRDSLAERTQSAPRVNQAVIVRPRTRALPFIIAETESEVRLTRNYGVFAALFFTLALFAAGWAAAILLRYFGIS